MVNFEIASVSEHGPRKLNEDAILTCIQYDENGNEIVIAVIADGLGGYQAGNIASNYVTMQIQNWLQQNKFRYFNDKFHTGNVSRQLQQLFLEMNRYLLLYMQQQLQKLGTTCSLLLLYQGQFIVVHVGDSRIYRFQKTDSFKSAAVQQLTKDHAWVETEISAGRLTKEQARIHNRRNVLLQCVGIEEHIMPQTLIGTYATNDIFLLCTDGIHEVLAEPILFGKLLNALQVESELQHSLNQWLRELTPFLRDNASAILLKHNSSIKIPSTIIKKVWKLLSNLK